MIKRVRKRNYKLEKFDQQKITNAVELAFKSVNHSTKDISGVSKKLSNRVVRKLNKKFGAPTVDQIQDIVEEVIVKAGYHRVAKAYILYRSRHDSLREFAHIMETDKMVDSYLDDSDWTSKENANMGKSLQGLNVFITTKIISTFWRTRLYPENIQRAHEVGDLHIHDLGILGPYCVGWDLRDLLTVGFGNVPGKIACRPPKHFSSALGQSTNFMYTLQGEAAGAQAFSNFDTMMAPFIKVDNLDYKETEQRLEHFLYEMNVPTRVGAQTPFTNITMDLVVPKFMRDEGVIIGGKMQNFTYGDCQEELTMFNEVYNNIMLQGDANGRVFTFPIVTYNVTKDFDWENETLFKLTGKYGTPYFSNLINSDMDPEDVRSMCCRLRIDNSSLERRGGGFFGANPLTGSIGVVTLNMPRLAYTSKDEDEFFERLIDLMDLAKNSLEIKRKIIERFTESGLYPYSSFYLRVVKERFNKYWSNHFLTIGLIGMNEACMNLLGENIVSDEGLSFSEMTLRIMNDKILEYQMETGNMYNLEATPAEGTTYRLAKMDKEQYPKIIVANESYLPNAEPFYTNSTQLPVDADLGIFKAMRHQENLQPLYTGGTVHHIFMGESVSNWQPVSKLIRKVCENTILSYCTFTPSFSICSTHGHLGGVHYNCPFCKAVCEVYTRVVGYIRPVRNWNPGKRSEFDIRRTYTMEVS